MSCSTSIPGDGAGAFIEYESGGTYHVTTSCDVGQGWRLLLGHRGDAAGGAALSASRRSIWKATIR